VRRRVVLAAVGVGVSIACGVILPERYAVNAPLRNLIWGGGIDAAPRDIFARRVRAAEGWDARVFARDVAGARFLRFTRSGDLLVSTPRSGRVLLVRRDADGDGQADGVETLLDDLDRPHGLDVDGEWLYVAETGAIGRIRFDAARRTTEGPFTRIVTGLPSGGNHWTRTVRVGPDRRLYVAIGSSCNVCIERDRRRAAIVRYELDGSGGTLFATGLRNAVGFDWRPETGELFATDNGRDLLGDDFPPCELDRVVEGGFYGWPFANGDRVPDPDFGAGREAEIAASIPPAHGFRAHNAPLGITFVRGADAPAAYRGAAIVALHGSWNRTRKDGYKVVSLHWDAGGRITERDFLVGFLDDEDVIGRPVDAAEGPDGAVYVSDDYAGAIYRVAPVRDAAVGPPGTSARAAARAPAPPLAGLPADERAAAAARGATLYAQFECASCHDPARAAPGVVTRPLAALGRRWDVETLAAFLAAPTPPMPAFPLSNAERRDLAVHLLATWP
jgi:glucose/arabinose dehydrogenase